MDLFDPRSQGIPLRGPGGGKLRLPPWCDPPLQRRAPNSRMSRWRMRSGYLGKHQLRPAAGTVKVRPGVWAAPGSPPSAPPASARTGAEPCRALASNNSRVGQPSRPEFLVSLSAHHTARCRMESVTKGGVSAARHADVAARGVRGAADARTSVRSFGSYRRPPRKARRPRSLDEKTTKLVWTPSPGARGHSGTRVEGGRRSHTLATLKLTSRNQILGEMRGLEQQRTVATKLVTSMDVHRSPHTRVRACTPTAAHTRVRS